jgi:hypothetical protein
MLGACSQSAECVGAPLADGAGIVLAQGVGHLAQAALQE